MLLRPEMSREQRDQIVNNIHSETLRLNSLASSFLDLARLESGRVQFRKTRFSVADLIYECSDVMTSKAQETSIQIRVDVPSEMPLMEADRDKIKQVLLNLLSNAIKYNRPNGSVIVTGNFTRYRTIHHHSGYRPGHPGRFHSPSFREILSGART